MGPFLSRKLSSQTGLQKTSTSVSTVGSKQLKCRAYFDPHNLVLPPTHWRLRGQGEALSPLSRKSICLSPGHSGRVLALHKHSGPGEATPFPGAGEAQMWDVGRAARPQGSPPPPKAGGATLQDSRDPSAHRQLGSIPPPPGRPQRTGRMDTAQLSPEHHPQLKDPRKRSPSGFLLPGAVPALHV